MAGSYTSSNDAPPRENSQMTTLTRRELLGIAASSAAFGAVGLATLPAVADDAEVLRSGDGELSGLERRPLH